MKKLSYVFHFTNASLFITCAVYENAGKALLLQWDRQGEFTVHVTESQSFASDKEEDMYVNVMVALINRSTQPFCNNYPQALQLSITPLKVASELSTHSAVRMLG